MAMQSQGWRTRAQIIDLHGGDARVADDIIEQKVSTGMVDDHPDIKGVKTYYVPSLSYKFLMPPVHTVISKMHIYICIEPRFALNLVVKMKRKRKTDWRCQPTPK